MKDYFDFINLIINIYTFIFLFIGFLCGRSDIKSQLKASNDIKVSNHINSFLQEAYLDIENYVRRRPSTKDDKRRFERAIAKIQLLGTQQQAQKARIVARRLSSRGNADVASLLYLLGKDLRKDLKLSEYKKPVYMRFR